MPELPEVEIHARSLRQWLAGRTVTGFEFLDPLLSTGEDLSHGSAALLNHRTTGVRRLAKYLLVDLESGRTLVAHLRMTGRFVRDGYVTGPPEKPTRFFLDLDDGSRVRFEDRRRFGRLWITETGNERELPELRVLGPDALLEPLDGPALRERIGGSRRGIKSLLMDQRFIGGIGNIYAAEILYRAGVHPDTPAHEISDSQAAEIARLTSEILDWAVETQSRRDLIYLGEQGAENVFTIYRREGTPCPRCDTPIVRTVTGGRGTYWCPGCQPASQSQVRRTRKLKREAGPVAPSEPSGKRPG